MVVNPDKFQVMFLGSGGDGLSLDICDFTIRGKDTVKLLGITLDRKLSFSNHISEICDKANRKISALLRIRKFLNTRKAFLLFNAYIMSHFKYFPLIWMFSSKGDSQKIDSTQVRALRVVMFNFEKTRHELFSNLNLVSIHTSCLHLLLAEVFKSIHKLNPEFMWEMFTVKRTNRELRRKLILNLPTNNGKSDIVFRAVLAWNNLPAHIMHSENLKIFRSYLKGASKIYCTCKICS